MKATLLGKKRFYTSLKAISTVDLPGIYRGSLKKTANRTLKASLKKTPIDTGHLRASASAKVLEVSPEGGEAEVKYTAKYSIPVHEILTSHHPVGQAKFLESTVLSMMPVFPRIVGKSIRKFLSKTYYRQESRRAK